MNSLKLKRNRSRHKKILDIKELHKLATTLKKDNKKIVFTIGSFYLAEAKALGDILVVGVTTDFSDARTKGSGFPLIGQDVRAELISFLKSVDYVIPVDEKNPYDVLLLLQPDIFFTTAKSWETGLRDKRDKDILKTFGGKLVKRNVTGPYHSTSDLVDHVANIRVIKILENYLTQQLNGFHLNPETDLKPADYGSQTPKYKNAFDANVCIATFEQLAGIRKKLKAQKNKVVLVSGSYDLLHVGHARFIEQAGLLGDTLVVAIPSDKSMRALKGAGRPIISEQARAYVLSHLDPVDYVVIFNEYSVFDTLDRIKPDVFFTVEEEWNNGYKDSKEYKLVTSYGGKVVRAKRQAPHLSSSVIIDKLAQKKVRDIFRECMDDGRINELTFEKSVLVKS
jgi:D-beta-D-heptose 7-phosphate kinase/D-beta-D-heptose 1-phosphate adenosyltransferase